MTAGDGRAAGGDGSGGLRIGIDLGGTKISGVLLDRAGARLAATRVATPRGDYAATVEALAAVIATLETGREDRASVGIGMPGSISPATGRAQNANSVWLNERPFGTDLEARLGRPVRLANDANCFALSEATDGAGAGAAIVLGVILGTGCGGGIVIGGRLVDGPRGIGGEWGHNPLPRPAADEHPGPDCWCGRRGCMEAWVSGPALARDHAARCGRLLPVEEIAALAEAGDAAAGETLQRHASRLARGLTHVVNILDPDVIVLGGGLSRLNHLYERLPALMAPHIFADSPSIDVRPPRWGDDSGVRGAAWLWGVSGRAAAR